MTYIRYDAYIKRTTVFLPDELHENLRQEAFKSRISMASLIRLRLETPVTSKTTRGKRVKREKDPLLRVIGICSGPTISDTIVEDLYGI